MLDAKFYETYYFCNVINNVLHNQFDWAVELNDFYGDGRIFSLINSFSKFSAFHEFIAFIVESIYTENSEKIDFKKMNKLPIEWAFDYHHIDYQSFKSYLKSDATQHTFLDDAYHEWLRASSSYEALIDQTVSEVFYVLFQNRGLLLRFNNMLSSNLEGQIDDAKTFGCEYISEKGRIKRTHIPSWVKRAVFYRDRGRCVLCDKDLSGTLSLDNHANYDHMVALANCGFNDVSNIQLLCKECNQIGKRAGEAVTSTLYQNW
ncbi:TPA: HNH endonuclease [Photobacterium damselae]